jgi:hypothetical protein
MRAWPKGMLIAQSFIWVDIKLKTPYLFRSFMRFGWIFIIGCSLVVESASALSQSAETVQAQSTMLPFGLFTDLEGIHIIGPTPTQSPQPQSVFGGIVPFETPQPQPQAASEPVTTLPVQPISVVCNCQCPQSSPEASSLPSDTDNIQ